MKILAQGKSKTVAHISFFQGNSEEHNTEVLIQPYVAASATSHFQTATKHA
jgi:hypothetical protein